MYCKYCGKPNVHIGKYCSYCGTLAELPPVGWIPFECEEAFVTKKNDKRPLDTKVKTEAAQKTPDADGTFATIVFALWKILKVIGVAAFIAVYFVFRVVFGVMKNQGGSLKRRHSRSKRFF